MARHERKTSIWSGSGDKKPGYKVPASTSARPAYAPPAARPQKPPPAEPPKPKTQVEAARFSKKQADADYLACAKEVKPLLEWVRGQQTIPLARVNKTTQDIIELAHKYEGTQLLENMQTIRLEYRPRRDDDISYYLYHSLNTALLCAIFGDLLKLEAAAYTRLVKLGYVMDLGMMALPQALRRRDTRLDGGQLAALRRHPAATVKMLTSTGEWDGELLAAVAAHHERYNGNGYPEGLKGTAIPEAARIAAIADTYDAAMQKREYDRRKSPFDILGELLYNQDMAMDPGLVCPVSHALAGMLKGRRVTLSDNSIGVVLDVDLNNIAYPLVKVVNRRVQTGPELYPVALADYFPLFGSNQSVD